PDGSVKSTIYIFPEFLRPACKIFIWVCLSFSGGLLNAGQDYVFSEINTKDGLSGNRVRSITQLSDGRMVIITEGLFNIYNGSTFHYVHYDESLEYSLSGYNGYHRLYTDGNDGLWLKN